MSNQINTLEEFAYVIEAWQKNVNDQLNHLLEVPEGTNIEIGEGEDTQSKVLTGDYLEGFTLGVQLAISTLNDNPPFLKTEDE